MNDASAPEITEASRWWPRQNSELRRKREQRVWSLVLRYGLATLLVGAAIVASKASVLILHVEPFVSLFLCAIILAAWVGGIGPGFLATGLAAVSFDYFVLPPVGSFAILPHEVARFALFLIVALFVNWISAKHILAARSLDRSRRELLASLQRQKQVETNLLRSEMYLTEAQRLSQTGSFGWKIPTGELRWSQETFRIFGYELDATPTPNLVIDRVHPEDRAQVKQVIDEAFASGREFDHEYRLLMPDGQVKHVRALTRAVKDSLGYDELIGAVTDVTAAKNAEQELRNRELRAIEAERQVRATLDTIQVVVWTALPDGTNEFHNKHLLSYTGLSADEARGERWITMVHPEDAPKQRAKWQEAVAAGTPFEFESRLRRFDGQYRWFLTRAVPLRDDEGKVIRWYGTSVDIDDLKQSQRLLQHSEQRFRDFAETASDWFWETDQDHRLSVLSREAKAVRVGSPAWQYATDLEEEAEKWQDHFKLIDAHQPFREFVFRIALPDGSPGYTSVSGKPLFDSTGAFLGYRGVASDVTATIRREQAETALRDAQAELAHAARVIALGELTTSIAHEVNQPLTAILSNAEVSLRWLDRGAAYLDRVRQSIEWIVKDVNRAADVIGHVRALARKTDSGRTAFDLNEVVTEVSALLRRELLENQVELKLDLSPSPLIVCADRIQLQQVIMNLLMNGIEAMQPISDRPRKLVLRSECKGPCEIQVMVEDCGIGISAADPEKLFDAFFTTKSSGLGLGLSICRTIIESHGGRLSAAQRPEFGAAFQFTLPLRQQT
ncbi:PAS domain-containing protein [Bradyrhizobium sp. STM 3557]|uniref:PAS domain-containing protein n=1 Tax=Bradyrhizobium sp. STM 3557 TaxID=578920 RepID=UPI00388D5B2D